MAIIAYLLFSKKENEDVSNVVNKDKAESPKSITEASNEKIFSDEKGRFIITPRSREIPRKTYLLGTLNGKYWGEIDPQKKEEYQYSKFYDFHIYEADVTNSEISLSAFSFIPDSTFPRERLPKLLPIIIKKDDKEYSVNIHEPQLGNINFVSKLHQTEGNEVFGTIEAKITGFLLDFITEEYTEKSYLADSTIGLAPIKDEPPKLTPTSVPTGNIEFKNGYERTEYYYSNYKTTYWGNWKYNKSANVNTSEGCLSSGLGIIGAILGIAFLLLALPQIVFLLPFFLLPLIFRLIPESAWIWIFRIVGILVLLGFVISIINAINNTSRTYIPKPVVQDKPEERRPQFNPIVDTVNNSTVKDTLITHFRSWQDYNGNLYAGKFWVKASAYANASSYKNNLNLPEISGRNYDEIIFRLKENDKNDLLGISQMFDSIKTANNLSSDDFAEMIVSFVQDIPYSVVLPSACDPALYADDFIRNYLASKDAKCDGYERFGINTPVEFMATLHGDCDTRTLLVYTLLSYYDYDVALLSSEYYSHSLIGINLPYDGISYRYNTQRYVLWETTAPNIRPGILPNEISNTNYWRISLKSK